MKRLILDADGVMLDFSNHLLRMVGSKLSVKDITDWNFFKFLTPEEGDRARRVLRESSFWLSQPALYGAGSALVEIQRQYEVVWATSPWPDCETWGWCRRQVLGREFGVRPRDILIVERKELIPGDVLVDDRAETVEAWQRAHPEGQAWLFDAPYNQHLDWKRRLTWDDKLPFGRLR